MKISKFLAHLSLTFISTLSVSAHAFDFDCIYGTYPTMEKTWGTWTEWTDAEEAYYDKLEMYHSFARFTLPLITKADTRTHYNYESFNEPLKSWFVAPNAPNEFWYIWPIALANLGGEVPIPLFESCGPTGDEIIIE
ncbi:MAG: hypothetical protein COA96_16230 [SAR86 cluster bacterium]|uniref:Uncharacterized protein n=1 Tax=SAR86 cluster bacterium TaxID=2030880 RepID=A0A2A5AJQ5_9GAMM|nr:MAG: hypothetical protein COA96_16230 [SAR86 cluster bacterium]